MLGLTDEQLVLYAASAGIVVYGAILYGLARLSGWASLGHVYPANDTFLGTKNFAASARFKRFAWFPANYSSVLIVGVNAYSVYFSVWLPFRPFHPPLSIPIADIRGTEKSSELFKHLPEKWRERMSARLSKRVSAGEVELSFTRAPDVTIVISAKLADWIAEETRGNWTYARAYAAKTSAPLTHSG